MENLQYIYKLAADAIVFYSYFFGVIYSVIFLNWFWYRKKPKLMLESNRDVNNNITAYITLKDRPVNMWLFTRLFVLQFVAFSFWITIMSIVIAIVSIAMFFFS
jgi:hypothetical protein